MNEYIYKQVESLVESGVVNPVPKTQPKEPSAADKAFGEAISKLLEGEQGGTSEYTQGEKK